MDLLWSSNSCVYHVTNRQKRNHGMPNTFFQNWRYYILCIHLHDFTVIINTHYSNIVIIFQKQPKDHLDASVYRLKTHFTLRLPDGTGL